jgi:hypothetical protein
MTIGDGIIERFCERAAHQNCKVGVFTSFISIAVPVHGYDSTMRFRHHLTVWIHTEGAHFIIECL